MKLVQLIVREDLVHCQGVSSEIVASPKALKRIKKFDGYGMQIAQKYFREIGKGKVLRRKIQISCNANSFFKKKRFEKNLQTRTYRIWKYILASEVDFLAPALEKCQSLSQIKIFEGYPSLSWRTLFKSPTR